jgi:16S rRNA (guanine1207-N2)-methyltransferase
VSNHYFSKKPQSEIKKGLIKTMLRGKKYSFNTASGVFSTKKIDNGTRILIENMRLPEKGDLLDLGCGYGVIGIVAASLNPNLNVTLTDVNERATSLAKINVYRNGLKNVKILNGYIYEPITYENFDVIISNPPISAGMNKIVKRIIYDSTKHLKSKGTLQLVIQWNKGGRTLAKYLNDVFGSYQVLARKSGYRVLLSFLE